MDLSLFLGITYEKDIFEAAEISVLEVNNQLPRTFGDTQGLQIIYWVFIFGALYIYFRPYLNKSRKMTVLLPVLIAAE